MPATFTTCTIIKNFFSDCSKMFGCNARNIIKNEAYFYQAVSYRHPPLNPLPSREGIKYAQSQFAIKSLGEEMSLSLPLWERVRMRDFENLAP